MEAERAAEREGAEGGVFAGFLDSLARLVAGPRLAYGLGMAAVMVALIAKLQTPSAPPSVELAQVPVAPAPISPIVTPTGPFLGKRHAVELASGQVLLSGLLINGKAGTKLDLPENKKLMTLSKQSAILVLGDGTRVAMGSGTQVGVGEHEIRLSSGQVGVHVPKGGQGFRTVSPRMTTFVMGTRYLAGTQGVELVEGKVEVSSGKAKATLAPGQKASGTSVEVTPITVTPINRDRMANLYRFFGNLDGREGLAKDLGMTVAQLDATIDPPQPIPVASVPASAAPVKPPRGLGVAPGVLQMPDLEEKPEDKGQND